jgi:diguanylate cyclase (GGDEF)-like protein
VVARVKEDRPRADLGYVSRGPNRRAGDVRVSAVRRLGRALRSGLYRPLAGDDDRVAYWVRHVGTGVLLSEIAAFAVFVYALLTPTPGHHHPVLLVLAPLVMLTTPLLFLLPLADMVRDRRGPLMFYAWSIAVTALITVAARVDGGASSPLYSVLFLTLAYMAVAYPPYGVVAMGALMTASYLLFVALGDLGHYALFLAVVMASYTMICAMASANSWAAYDRQVELIRVQEALAFTDALTGVPNRRAFLGRLTAAIAAAPTGRLTVLCLVDLDGFKGVNDREGHAAGDAVLRSVTAALCGVVRDTDTVARLGGDEFAVLAEVTDDFPGEALAERLRTAVAAVGHGRGVTASVGVAGVLPGDDVEELLHRADSAMYRSKTAGGNRVTAPVA